ncbi:protein of unknown function DUF723 [Vibrio phage 2.275.O._10N.286.54.E11]|nr:protein of unknown function DUF723 [Vibrio phage 2.275.O._10N.286.54.E11]
MTNLEKFINKAKSKFGDRFDYSLIENFKNRQSAVTIICPDHGEFSCMARNHLGARTGSCPDCFIPNNSITQEQFIENFKKIHGEKYDLSKVVYKGAHTKVVIICSEHGEFEMTPDNLINGKHSCQVCGQLSRNKSNTLTQEEFIQKAKDVHGDLYDYSLIDYSAYDDRHPIICSKHGIFYQQGSAHISMKSGCPNCRTSKGELETKKILDDNNITYIQQYRVNDVDCKYYYDFYLPDYNLFVEYDGKQHYEFVPIFHKDTDGFNRAQHRDTVKTAKAEELGNILRIRYDDNVKQVLLEKLGIKH